MTFQIAHKTRYGILAGLIFSIHISCVTIPKEVPQLSFEIGQQMDRIQTAHLNLLEAFFQGKRDQVDQFMQKIWLPKFAMNFLNQPDIKAAWELARSTNKQIDILNLILLLGPELQAEINSKRLELIQPLNALQTKIKTQIESDYNLAKSMNLTLTSYLQSAQNVAANRDDFLSMMGISQEGVNTVIDQTDAAIAKLGSIGQKIEDAEATFESTKTALDSLLDNFN